MRKIIPYELIQVVEEYFKANPKKADIVVHGGRQSVRMGDIAEEIRKGSKAGIDYEKALYKMAFEDLISGRKIL